MFFVAIPSIKSHISQMMNFAREEAQLWLKRPLESEYLAIFIDATFFSTKRVDTYSKEAYFVVLGVRKDTTREILGIYNNPTEGAMVWQDFFDDLQKRGVKSINLVVSDALTGIENTIARYFPKADVQLCTVHLKRGMISKVKPEDKAKLALDLKEIFEPLQNKTPENAYTFFVEKISFWVKKYPSLKSTLTPRSLFYFTFLKYPISIRNMIYSTNWIERFNKSCKKILHNKGALPSAESVLFLMANTATSIKAYNYKIHAFQNFN